MTILRAILIAVSVVVISLVYSAHINDSVDLQAKTYISAMKKVVKKNDSVYNITYQVYNRRSIS